MQSSCSVTTVLLPWLPCRSTTPSYTTVCWSGSRKKNKHLITGCYSKRGDPCLWSPVCYVLLTELGRTPCTHSTCMLRTCVYIRTSLIQAAVSTVVDIFYTYTHTLCILITYFNTIPCQYCYVCLETWMMSAFCPELGRSECVWRVVLLLGYSSP